MATYSTQIRHLYLPGQYVRALLWWTFLTVNTLWASQCEYNLGVTDIPVVSHLWRYWQHDYLILCRACDEFLEGVHWSSSLTRYDLITETIEYVAAVQLILNLLRPHLLLGLWMFMLELQLSAELARELWFNCVQERVYCCGLGTQGWRMATSSIVGHFLLGSVLAAALILRCVITDSSSVFCSTRIWYFASALGYLQRSFFNLLLLLNELSSIIVWLVSNVQYSRTRTL